MRVTTIETPGLGDRSYLIDDGRIAVAVDPQRDIDRVTALLADLDVELALVCETHIHNDYVTGGLALARLTGADYAVNAADDVAFSRRPVRDGEVLDVGELGVSVLASPGHTPTHLAYRISQHGADGADGVFTGGSMLYATVGRTDLLGADLTDQLSRAQHRSVRALASDLPPATRVYPTHGFGSFCASAGGGSRTAGTVADERAENLAVQTEDEDEFVSILTGGFTAHPRYYAHMGLLNRAGPLSPDLSPSQTATPQELRDRIARGEWVVDVRDRTAFADAHVPGSISVDGAGSLATYLGWAIPWGTPLSLIGADAGQVADAQRELVRIGLDRPLTIATGECSTLADGAAATYPRRTFADLADAPDAQVVDVRRDDEWAAGHLDGAVHVTLERVADGGPELFDALPDGPLWVHCASGFRASIGASLLARAGLEVVYLDDAFDNAPDAGRSIIT